ARARADAALGDGAGGAGGQGIEHMLLGDVAAADVVDDAVIGLADYGVDGEDALIARLGERPFNEAGDALGDGEGVGEDDRRLDLAELLDLGGAGEFPVAVAGGEAGGGLVLEGVS